MTHRITLPNRRPNETREVVWRTETAEHTFHVTVGFDLRTGTPVEVFYSDGMKEGADLRHAAQDACILISLLIQYGVALADIGKSLAVVPVMGQDSPASIIGAIAEVLK